MRSPRLPTSPREHAGAGLGVHVVDGVELRLADAEDRHMAALAPGADAGVGQDVVHRQTVVHSRVMLMAGSSGGFGKVGVESVAVVAVLFGRAGRIWPRSSTKTMCSSALSLLTKVRKRLRTSGLVTAVFHSHW